MPERDRDKQTARHTGIQTDKKNDREGALQASGSFESLLSTDRQIKRPTERERKSFRIVRCPSANRKTDRKTEKKEKLQVSESLGPLLLTKTLLVSNTNVERKEPSFYTTGNLFFF